ncbi:hypothetical protein [Halosimplex sp. J119]
MHREQSRRRFLRGCCVAGAGTLAAGGFATGAAADSTRKSAPETRWDRTYSEATASEAEAIAPTGDGGFVAVGTIEPADSDNEREIWVSRLSTAGQVVWERTFAERAVTEGFDVAGADDGFIVVGHTREDDADAQDAVALRIDADGTEQWRRTFHVRPGTTDTIRAVDVDGDGRFIFAGWTSRFKDAWVVRMTDENNIDWAKRYGPGSRSRYHGVVTDSDGGYVVVGETDDTSGNTVGWANKLGEDGTQQFSQQFKKQSESSTNPYDDYNVFYDVTETRNGFVAVGANAFDPKTNEQRGWALEFNINGGKLWDKRYTENNYTELRDITYTNLEYYVVGETATDGNGTDARGYAAHLGIDGAMKWSGTWGDSTSGFTGFHLADDGGVVAVGDAAADGHSSAWSVKIGGEAVATRTPSPTPTPTATPADSNTPTFSPTPTDDSDGTVAAGDGGADGGAPTPTGTTASAGGEAPGDGSAETTTAAGDGGLSLVTIGVGAVILALGGGGVLYNRFLAGDDGNVAGPDEEAGGAAPTDTGDGGDDGGDGPQTTEPATDENQDVQAAQTVVEGEDAPDDTDDADVSEDDDDSGADEESTDE